MRLIPSLQAGTPGLVSALSLSELTQEKAEAPGIDGASVIGQILRLTDENGDMRIDRSPAEGLGRVTVRATAGPEMVVLTDKDRTVPRGQDKDPDQTDRGGEQAHLVLQDPTADRDRTARDRTDLDRMGQGRTDRRGEGPRERVTSRRARFCCLRG